MKKETQLDKDMKVFIQAMKQSLSNYRKAGIEPTLTQWIKDAEKK